MMMMMPTESNVADVTVDAGVGPYHHDDAHGIGMENGQGGQAGRPMAVQEEVASVRVQYMQQHFLSQLAKLEQQCQNYCAQIGNLTDRLHTALGDNQQLSHDLALAHEKALHNEGRVVS